MDWTQCLTIIGTTVGTAAGLFLITRKDIQLMDKNHREDLQHMDAKWERLFSLFIEQGTRDK